MTDTPDIDISSSDRQLNQRFKKPKSSLPIYLLVALLAILVVAVPLVISVWTDDENQTNEAGTKGSDGNQVATRNGKSSPRPTLNETNFFQELSSGEVASFDLSTSLRHADSAACKVEWNVADSTLPASVMTQVAISDQMIVSIPTAGLPNQTSSDSVLQNNEWKLVGRVVSGEYSTEEFSINLKVAHPNTPPVAQVPAAVEFDPVFGAVINASVSDQENARSQLSTRVIVDEKFESDFKVMDSNQPPNTGILFRPSKYVHEVMAIKLEVEDSGGLVSNFDVTLRPVNQSSISRFIAELKQEAKIDLSNAEINRIGGVVRLSVDVDGESLELLERANGDSGLPLGAAVLVEPSDGRLQFRQGGLTALCSPSNEKLSALLAKHLAAPVNPAAPASVKAEIATNAKLLKAAKTLLDDKRLFNPKSFGDLVFAFVDDFERENETVLDRSYRALPGLKEVFADQQGLKAELFLAINAEYDDLASVLRVFDGIRQKYPGEIVRYKNLAIAISVCWDSPDSIYSFVGHQRRTKSILPKKLTGAVDNFEHFVKYQDQMQGRAEWLPWEFLVHVVNHQTPEEERYWALGNYLNLRPMFGKCYKDVPYDFEMLNSRSQVCALGGKEYTLPNLRSFGGVCAMQADFAARVGKSLGVPAEYVGGQSASGDNHAWVMWVEVKNVTRSGVAFSLESFGRYRGDLYYVGRLKDPRSGQRITDRQLELRLHAVGTDAYAKRHVDLLMKVFPELVTSEEMDIKEQLKFLEQAIKLCPWHEGAWNAVADLISTNEIDRKMHRQMNQVLNSMFVHFAAFPDFTWEIFDRLVSFVPKDEDRNKYYVKLLNLYVAAQRPDLACEAQLKLTDDLEAQGQTQVAMQGLAVTIKAFPDEGRYVPRLLDRLEALVGDDPDLVKQLVQFHVEFLPLIPQKRGNRASKYCLKMYERAIQFFTKHQAESYADLYRAKLQEMRSLPQ